jgi:hypothetical protein
MTAWIMTKEELKILEEDGWELIDKDTLTFERCTQFAGTHKMSGEEEVKAELQAIDDSKKFKKYIEELSKKSFEKHIKDFKSATLRLLNEGITEDTLLYFYTTSNWFGRKYGETVTSSEIKGYFKEAFDEDERERQ